MSDTNNRLAKVTPDNPQGVALRIYRPTNTDYHLKALIYGEPGMGKTTLAATAMNHERTADVLVVNIEGGTMSIVNATEAGLPRTPDVIDLDEWSQLEEIFWFLRNGDHPYKTLVIDSLSELVQLNLDKVVQQAMARSKGDKKRTDPDEVFLDDHGKCAKEMTRVLQAFRDLPMHVIFTCHSLTEMDKDKNIVSIHPALPPKLRRSVLGYMDVVAFMYNEEVEVEGGIATSRRLLTQPVGKWTAKDRSPGGRLGKIMIDPTVPIMIDRIDGVSGE